jgi:hypothetical protein
MSAKIHCLTRQPGSVGQFHSNTSHRHDSKMKRALKEISLRLDRMRDVLDNLDQTMGREHSRSLALQPRPNQGLTGEARG